MSTHRRYAAMPTNSERLDRIAASAVAATLADTLGDEYQVITSLRGRCRVDVRVHPSRALRDNLDFLRIIPDDGTYKLVHLSHNEVNKGEATFSRSMVAMLPVVVKEWCEVTY